MMKKIITIVVLFVGFIFTNNAQNKSQTNQNLVRNGDFSNGLKKWYCEKHTDKVKIELQDGALKISRKEPKSFCRVFQDVKVRPGGLYTLSFRIKQGINSRYQFWLIFKTKKGKWLEKDIIFLNTNKDSQEWLTVKKTIAIPNDVTLVRLNFCTKGKDAVVLFDDICFKQVWQGKGKQNTSIPQLKNKFDFDGSLKDKMWDKALLLDDFRVLGKPMKPSKSKTEVRLVVVEDQLLIGLKVFGDMSKIRCSSQNDGFYVFNDQNIEIFLCPDKTAQQKEYIHLAINPLGFKASERKGGNSKHLPWWGAVGNDLVGPWEGKSQTKKDFWTAEIKLPLARLYKGTLNGEVSLYANFCRHQPGQKEPYSNWAGLSGQSFHVPGFFPKLELDLKENVCLEKEQSKHDSLEFSNQMDIPDILTVGKPIKVQTAKARLTLPESVEFSCKGLPIDKGLKKQIASIIGLGKGQKLTISCSLLQTMDLTGLKQAEKKKMKSPEAFLLSIGKKHIDIKGKSIDGILRGLATLVMIVKNEIYKGKKSIPCVKIWDAPGFKFRGWLLVGDTPAKLKPQIDLLYLLRCNVAQFEVSSYGKTVPFPFESLPEISNGRTTKKQWKDLADYARARGIRPVPIFYSWSRAGFILNRDKYAHLAERPDLRKGARLPRVHDRNFCAANPDSYKLIFKLYEEIIEAMSLKDLHIGHDEVHHDDVSVSKLAVEQNRQRRDWMIDTVIKTNEFCKKKGIQLWIYADCLDPGHNGRFFGIYNKKDFQSFKLPKNIILQDWKYEVGNHPSIPMLASSGYTTVSSCWESIPALSDLIRDTYKAGAVGHIGTSWSSTVPASILPEMTTMIPLGAYLSWSPQEYDLQSIPVAPGYYYQLAMMPPSLKPTFTKTVPLDAPANATGGKDLVNALGFPQGVKLDFLRHKVKTAQGSDIIPFTLADTPAGLIVKGNGKVKNLPINKKSKSLIFLHTTNAQDNSSMHKLKKRYHNKLAGTYVITYADGTEQVIPLYIRKQITWWNDRHAATKAESVLYGTLAKQLFVNIPAFYWKNPFPNKIISKIAIQPGNKDGVNLILLGLSLNQ